MPLLSSTLGRVRYACTLAVLLGLFVGAPAAIAERKPIPREYPAKWCPLNQSENKAQSGFRFKATARTMTLRFFADNYGAQGWNQQRLDHLVVVEEGVYASINPNYLAPNGDDCYLTRRFRTLCG